MSGSNEGIDRRDFLRTASAGLAACVGLNVSTLSAAATEKDPFLSLRAAFAYADHPQDTNLYPGEHVAIRGTQVVAHNSNTAPLLSKLRQDFPDGDYVIIPAQREQTVQVPGTSYEPALV